MDKYILINRHLKESNIVESNIHSFNHFIDAGLQQIIDENKEAEPAIIPQNIESFKIKFGKIWVGKPEIIEADGSRRDLYPYEARLRKITYSAPVLLETSIYINDIQRETFNVEICKLPIMLRSKYCHLNSLDTEELISKGEDPTDPGGYFIINGTEKVLVNVEDLAPNNLLVEPTGSKNEITAKIFSEHASYRIPHTINISKEGTCNISFTRVKEAPLALVIKALGLIKDEEIVRAVDPAAEYPEVIMNLFDLQNIKNKEDAMDQLAKKVGISQIKEIRLDRVTDMLNKYLLPHLGTMTSDQSYKAYNLCKIWKRYIDTINGKRSTDDKDHYMNKRLKLAGDLMMDLFRTNFKILVGDLLYNFQRIIKRGKLPSIRVIIREKLLTQRIHSSMATGEWVGGRRGIAQRLDRTNFMASLSHLQRVVSPLSASQENFQARLLHATHLGRLCPSETPEGTNIGLRKNLSMMSSISQESNEEEILNHLNKLGLQGIK